MLFESNVYRGSDVELAPTAAAQRPPNAAYPCLSNYPPVLIVVVVLDGLPCVSSLPARRHSATGSISLKPRRPSFFSKVVSSLTFDRTHPFFSSSPSPPSNAFDPPPLGPSPVTPKPVRHIELSTDPRAHTPHRRQAHAAAHSARTSSVQTASNLLDHRTSKPYASVARNQGTRKDRSDDCDSATATATATLRPGSELSQLPPVLSTFHLDLSLCLSLSLFRSPLHRTRLRRPRVVNTSLPPPICTARRIRSKPTPRNISRSPRQTRLVSLIHIHIHPRTLLVIDIRHWFL
ncbi:hypothetical protein CDEST_13557 [Colletotrichum destructivum]|uniref:Uncharacterized protein n=1 Tax=Colletotrichum destructivum TaxID=34406 RepID=A0AAX4IZ19_9PEZI|nr:hypothetical protein CDEST_13557 [Colletotrichum destructivum]